MCHLASIIRQSPKLPVAENSSVWGFGINTHPKHATLTDPSKEASEQARQGNAQASSALE